MNRLLATLRIDIRLQFRNGFYYASAFVVGLWALLVSQLPAFNLGGLMPVMVLFNLVIGTFYFFGGLVLLEKGEGTLEAQVVTPVRTREYLGSKIISLAGLGVLESLALVALIYGLRFGVPLLAAGTALGGVIFALLGFLVVARYDSINEYLMPSMLLLMPMGLPVLPYFGMAESWLLYLHPLQAPLALIEAAFQPVPAWRIAYGLLYSSLWIGGLSWLSQRTFRRFIIAREGVN